MQPTKNPGKTKFSPHEEHTRSCWCYRIRSGSYSNHTSCAIQLFISNGANQQCSCVNLLCHYRCGQICRNCCRHLYSDYFSVLNGSLIHVTCGVHLCRGRRNFLCSRIWNNQRRRSKMIHSWIICNCRPMPHRACRAALSSKIHFKKIAI